MIIIKRQMVRSLTGLGWLAATVAVAVAASVSVFVVSCLLAHRHRVRLEMQHSAAVRADQAAKRQIAATDNRSAGCRYQCECECECEYEYSYEYSGCCCSKESINMCTYFKSNLCTCIAETQLLRS